MASRKRVVKFANEPISKHIVNEENPDVFNNQFPVWRFSELDFEGKWGWNYLGSIIRFTLNKEIEDLILATEDNSIVDSFIEMDNKYYTYDKFIAHLNRKCKKSPSIDLLNSLLKHLQKDYLKKKIIDKLSQFENTSWETIKREQYGKKGKSKHHYQDINNINSEAQKRLIDLSLDDAILFTFRLDGSTRVWGLLDRGVFSLLWFDPYHEIYPSSKKDNNTKIIK